MVLKPEDSMKIQNQIGGDIMMALDDVVKTTTEGPRMAEAADRTVRYNICFLFCSSFQDGLIDALKVIRIQPSRTCSQLSKEASISS